MLDQYEFERRSAQEADIVLLEASAPPPSLDLIEWAEENFILPDGPQEGQHFTLAKTPYLEPILRRLSPQHPENKIAVRKSAQVGYTTVLIIWLLAIIARIGGKGMSVMPSLNSARDFNEEKLQPAIDSSIEVAKQIDQVLSKARFKKFAGGYVRLTGANSAADLRSKTIRWMACDEVDQWPLDLDGQGDPMGMVEARQFSFIATGEFKRLIGSTPTIEGSSRIDDEYEAGTQCGWEVPCPACGEYQFLEWEQLSYNEEWPHEAQYICPHCGEAIGHHEKDRMVRAGRESAPRAQGRGRKWSYEVNALYSPFVTWDAMVAAYVAAKDDPLALKAWTNLWQGRSFRLKGDAPGWKDLQERAQAIKATKRGHIPDWVLFLTAGADVQGGRIEIVIYGWGIGKTRIAIDWIILEGDTSDLPVWGRLTEVWQAVYQTRSGKSRRIEMLAIDAGYRPDMVCAWVRGKEAGLRGQPKAMAVRGTTRVTDWILGNPKKTEFDLPGRARSARGHVMVWWVGSHIGKASFYGFISLKGPNEAGQFPPGFVHFAEDFEEEFYLQATAETLRPIEKKTGGTAYQWEKVRQRNEVLDCSVYAHAAAIQLGMDKMTPDQWAALFEERTECAPEKGQLDLLSAVVAPPPDPDAPKKPVKPISQRLA